MTWFHLLDQTGMHHVFPASSIIGFTTNDITDTTDFVCQVLLINGSMFTITNADAIAVIGTLPAAVNCLVSQ
jgi:hypothetical protein